MGMSKEHRIPNGQYWEYSLSNKMSKAILYYNLNIKYLWAHANINKLLNELINGGERRQDNYLMQKNPK